MNLPSPEQTQGMDRAALVSVLASPEVATALKALGITAVGPTMPLRALRALVEALRAVAAMPQPVASRPPNLHFDPKILEAIGQESAEVLTSIVSQLNARGELHPDMCIEIPDPSSPELLLTWSAKSAHNDGPLTEVRLHVGVHYFRGSHYEPYEPPCLSLCDRAHKERLLCKDEIKDMMLTAASLCRTVLGKQGFAISEVAAEPWEFAQLVKQALQDTLRPEPKPEPEPEPVFTNEPNVVKEIYGEVSRLKIKDLSLVHSPFAWPNAFLVEWRGWSDHSGTPHYIQVVPNPHQGAPGILVCLLARTNSGPTQVGHMGCKPDVQDFLHATAKLYANALTQLGVTPYEVKAPPSSFAQDVAAHMLSTSPVSASWDPAIGPDDVPF